MKRALYALILILSITNCFALEIPQDKIIQNERITGYCVWCCLETLGNVHGIPQLNGLKKARMDMKVDYRDGVEYPSNWGYEWAIDKTLSQLKVRYSMTDGLKPNILDDILYRKVADTRDRSLLWQAEKNGVIIGYRVNKKNAHAVVLTKYTDTTIEYYDPNTKLRYIGSRAWFDYYWTGLSVVVYKD